MLHHASIPVADIKASKRLYKSALAELGYIVVAEATDFVGFGTEFGKDRFAIKRSVHVGNLGPQGHLAFTARTRADVDRFFEKAIANGGIDNGRPGLRSHYGPNYYACFIVDRDGHHVQAVYNQAPSKDA